MKDGQPETTSVKNFLSAITNGIPVRGYTIDENVHIDLASLRKQLGAVEICDMVFTKKVTLTFFRSSQFRFVNSEFRGGIDIESPEVSSVEFEECKIWTLNIKSITHLKLIACSISFLNISKNPTSRIELIGKQYPPSIEVSRTSEIENVILEDFNGSLTVDSYKVGKMTVSGTLNKQSQLQVRNSKLNQIELRELINLGTIKFQDVESIGDKTRILFQFSDLGDFRLTSVNLNSFKRVYAADVHLTQLRIYNVRWFKKLNGNNYFSSGKKREVYRQLKQVAIEHKDKTLEMFFQAREMDAYCSTLSLKHEFWDKLVLLLNRYSNYYGQWWVVPALWLIGLGGFMFYYVLDFSGYSLFENWGHFFSFLNPIHKNDFLDGKPLGNKSLALDYGSRVVMAYFYFQVVQGFRKFSRK